MRLVVFAFGLAAVGGTVSASPVRECVEPFSPFRQGYGSGFTEGNAWQYTWHVLHEPEALMDAMGGKAAFCEKLEGLFRQPEKMENCRIRRTR